jgi:hypothetical protein
MRQPSITKRNLIAILSTNFDNPAAGGKAVNQLLEVHCVSSKTIRGYLFRTVQRGQSILYFQGECKMNMPSSIAGWCTILFFLFFGLSLLGLAIPSVIIGILALGAAVFTLIGR